MELKRKNALVSSATPKDPEDHRKQLKNPFTTVGQIKNTLQEVDVSVFKSQQSREDFTRENTDGSPQDVNHW